MKTVKIGGGQGFYGDTPLPALEMARKVENLNYIAFDCLSELTLSILQKDKRRDLQRGFTLDLLALMPRLLPIARERNIKIITNGGGMNPHAAREVVLNAARKLGLNGLKVGLVTGDDVLDRLPEFMEKGYMLESLDTGQPLSESGITSERIVNANAYLGANVIAEALAQGADVVITGRVTDSALFLGPLLYEFGWKTDDWDRLAAGIVCGHLLECAGQVVGGNYAGGWQELEDLDRIGYPVAEVKEDGSFIVTKTPGTGGRVSWDTVREQLLYEVLDPNHYLTPDVDADFTSVQLEAVGENRVKVSGIKGRPRPETLKVCLGYEDGFMGEAQICYSWPDALAKARRADEILRKILAANGLKFEEIRSDFMGYNSLHGPLSSQEYAAELNEVVYRIAVRTGEEKEAERLFRELVPLALNGPPTATGNFQRTRPRELLALWSTLLPRHEIESQVKIELSEV
jgi:hypothetical protein